MAGTQHKEWVQPRPKQPRAAQSRTRREKGSLPKISGVGQFSSRSGEFSSPIGGIKPPLHPN